ncbi:hypothetical protein [Sporosarcina sp. FSL K6-1508]|uniref:hypothetical protein n=1 Tax=Sporosarcina sp. FSL K6-1508 TaxID=2921553 RepID=UPI0030F83CE3
MAISLLEDETLKFWDRLIVGAKVTIDSIEKEFPIFLKEIQGNTLKIFVELESEIGHITHAVIIDMHGREVRYKTMNINKGEHGLMVTFFLAIEIKEGTVNG